MMITKPKFDVRNQLRSKQGNCKKYMIDKKIIDNQDWKLQGNIVSGHGACKWRHHVEMGNTRYWGVQLERLSCLMPMLKTPVDQQATMVNEACGCKHDCVGGIPRKVITKCVHFDDQSVGSMGSLHRDQS